MFDHSGARALGGLPRSRGGGGGDPGRHEAVEREMTKYVFYGSRSRIVEVEEELGSRKELFPISSQNATWDPIIKKIRTTNGNMTVPESVFVYMIVGNYTSSILMQGIRKNTTVSACDIVTLRSEGACRQEVWNLSRNA